MSTKVIPSGYGSIPHLIGSRRGPGDHGCNEGEQTICTQKCGAQRKVVVEEKADGTCVAVICVNGTIMAINRAGYPCESSKWIQHRHFHQWVESVKHTWPKMLEGERWVFEWCSVAHGTKYKFAFDVPPCFLIDTFDKDRRCSLDIRKHISEAIRVREPIQVHDGPLDTLAAYGLLLSRTRLDLNPCSEYIDPPEGLVYRVTSRTGEHQFLAKWVNPDKTPGLYLPVTTGGSEIFNQYNIANE